MDLFVAILVSNRGVAVHTKHGEAVRRLLNSQGWLDLGRKPRQEGNWLWLPVIEGTPQGLDLGVYHEWVVAEFEEREARPTSLKDAPDLPPEVAEEVTRSMDVVGDIAILKLKDTLLPMARQIGNALLFVQPRLKAVALDRGVKGELRVRDLELLAGKGPLVTVHREYGLDFKVDLENAYFSPRLATEHNRVAELVQRGETLLDMFCGVGPFAIMAAKRGNTREVHAVDINPKAIELAQENAKLNRVVHLVHFHHGDARDVVPGLGTFDRIVMNHPHGARDFLDLALRVARKEAVIHLHMIGTQGEVDHAMEAIVEGPHKGGVAALRPSRVREVRTYAPSVSHWCLDLVVER